MVVGIELVGADAEDRRIRYLLRKLHGGTTYLMASMTPAVVRLVVGCSRCHGVGMVAGHRVVVAVDLARRRCRFHQQSYNPSNSSDMSDVSGFV